MTLASKGYLINKASKEIHNLGHLSEACNTDDILSGNRQYIITRELNHISGSVWLEWEHILLSPCAHCIGEVTEWPDGQVKE